MRKCFTFLSITLSLIGANLHSQTTISMKPLGSLKFECFEELVVIGYSTMKVRRCEIVPCLRGREMSVSEMSHTKADTISPQGTVVDKLTGEPIAGATIRWLGGSPVYTSDNEGKFGMCAAPEKENKLEISSIGYQTLVIDKPLLGVPLSYKLTPIYKQLEEVIVVGYDKRKIECGWSISTLQGKQLSNPGPDEWTKLSLLRCGVSGVFVTASNYVNDSVKPIRSKVAMNIYPNPAQAGNDVNLKLQNENSGVYKIEIFDVSGKIVEAKYVKAISKYKVISLSTSPGWIKGTYLIRISQTTGTNVEVGKLVIN
jgi:carboxypeptidase-like protein/type IX secretion system substrate protein